MPLKQAVENIYSKTPDAYEEKQAKRWEMLAQKALAELTGEKIANLNVQVQEQIAFYLDKGNMTPGGKVALLHTIIQLPSMFNQKTLITFFASRYFGSNKEKNFLHWERKRVFGIVEHARLTRTFKGGLNMTEPVPLPINRQNGRVADGKLGPQKAQEGVEAGMAKMSLSS